MAAFLRVIGRLPRIFNKDPKSIGAVTINYAGTDAVAIIGPQAVKLILPDVVITVPLEGLTLQGLVNTLNATGKVSAALVSSEYATLLAVGLIEDNVVLDGTVKLQYPTSVLHSELKTYGFVIDEQTQHISQAERELYMDTADGMWQDYWIRDHFGINRLDGEIDDQYFDRAKYEILSIKLNNKALEKLISHASGIKVSVVDLAPAKYFMTNDPASLTNNNAKKMFYDKAKPAGKSNAFGVFIYSGNVNDLTDRAKTIIKNACEKYRAYGTAPFYYAPVAFLDTNVADELTNDKGYVVGPDTGQWVPVAL